MKCVDIEAILPAYFLGELEGAELEDCRNHLESCENCRCALEFYAEIVSSMEREPELVVSASESAALTAALDRVSVRRPVERTDSRPTYEMVGFGLASVVMLVVITAVMNLHSAGLTRFLWNPLMIIPALAVVIFVTSFLPIAITVRREQLKEMNRMIGDKTCVF